MASRKATEIASRLSLILTLVSCLNHIPNAAHTRQLERRMTVPLASIAVGDEYVNKYGVTVNRARPEPGESESVNIEELILEFADQYKYPGSEDCDLKFMDLSGAQSEKCTVKMENDNVEVDVLHNETNGPDIMLNIWTNNTGDYTKIFSIQKREYISVQNTSLRVKQTLKVSTTVQVSITVQVVGIKLGPVKLALEAKRTQTVSTEMTTETTVEQNKTETNIVILESITEIEPRTCVRTVWTIYKSKLRVNWKTRTIFKGHFCLFYKCRDKKKYQRHIIRVAKLKAFSKNLKSGPGKNEINFSLSGILESGESLNADLFVEEYEVNEDY